VLLGGVDMDNFLIPLFSAIATVAFYPVLMIYVALIAGAGVFTWLIFTVMFTPFIVSWYYILRKRTLFYLKYLLDNRPHEWNIDKAIAEYQELLEKKERSITRD